MDDGSTDGSVAEIEDLLGPDVRLIHQENSGLGAARNRGIAEARYEWVALLDADDRWMKNHLSTFARLVADFPEADVVASSFRRALWEDTRNLAQQTDSRDEGYLLDYFTEAARREAVWTFSVAIRREAFVRTSGFETFWPGEDQEFWARLALSNTFAATSKVTAFYTTHTGGIIDKGESSGLDRSPSSTHGLIGTVEKALADPRYAAIHRDLRHYLDSFLLRLYFRRIPPVREVKRGFLGASYPIVELLDIAWARSDT
ncbi:MAG: glycosyltransferase [Pseudomonadota bacterium]|nr:glycosyltransferase [Pseudomonadota bacterium]